jgi:hypothetical protein
MYKSLKLGIRRTKIIDGLRIQVSILRKEHKLGGSVSVAHWVTLDVFGGFGCEGHNG